MPLSTIKTSLLLILILSGLSASSQSGALYNWKGNDLPLYEYPSAGSRVLINIPKGGAVQRTGSTAVLPDFNIILSYYGSMAAPKAGDDYRGNGTWYSLPGKWIKIKYQDKTGYVPQLFLSPLPDHAIPEGDHEELEKTTASYMAGFFGAAISKQKKELKKQDKGEINYERTYRYRNGDYYKVAVNYLDGGIGGETHTLFLKGLKKHEALMLLLKLTSLNDIMPEGIKKRAVTKSLYDKFSWWYNKDLVKEDKAERNIDMEFFYAQEGATNTLTVKETKDGIMITYQFGAC